MYLITVITIIINLINAISLKDDELMERAMLGVPLMNYSRETGLLDGWMRMAEDQTKSIVTISGRIRTDDDDRQNVNNV